MEKYRSRVHVRGVRRKDKWCRFQLSGTSNTIVVDPLLPPIRTTTNTREWEHALWTHMLEQEKAQVQGKLSSCAEK